MHSSTDSRNPCKRDDTGHSAVRGKRACLRLGVGWVQWRAGVGGCSRQEALAKGEEPASGSKKSVDCQQHLVVAAFEMIQFETNRPVLRKRITLLQ